MVPFSCILMQYSQWALRIFTGMCLQCWAAASFTSHATPEDHFKHTSNKPARKDTSRKLLNTFDIFFSTKVERRWRFRFAHCIDYWTAAVEQNDCFISCQKCLWINNLLLFILLSNFKPPLPVQWQQALLVTTSDSGGPYPFCSLNGSACLCRLWKQSLYFILPSFSMHS